MCYSRSHHHVRHHRHTHRGMEDLLGDRPAAHDAHAFDREPAVLVPEPHHLRASDAERDAVAEALRSHAATGRLDPEELEQRLERAYGAEVRADLLPLVADLPASARRRERRESARPDLAPLVLIAVALVAIWAITGAGYFWPVWPIGAMALVAFKHRRHHGRAPRAPVVEV